jgi:hypothetical protein
MSSGDSSAPPRGDGATDIVRGWLREGVQPKESLAEARARGMGTAGREPRRLGRFRPYPRASRVATSRVGCG